MAKDSVTLRARRRPGRGRPRGPEQEPHGAPRSGATSRGAESGPQTAGPQLLGRAWPKRPGRVGRGALGPTHGFVREKSVRCERPGCGGVSRLPLHTPRGVRTGGSGRRRPRDEVRYGARVGCGPGPGLATLAHARRAHGIPSPPRRLAGLQTWDEGQRVVWEPRHRLRGEPPDRHTWLPAWAAAADRSSARVRAASVGQRPAQNQ